MFVQLPENVIEMIYVASRNILLPVVCKKLFIILNPSFYLQKMYCTVNFSCRCHALRYVLKQRFVNDKILQYLSNINCELHENPLVGYFVPYCVLSSQHKALSTKLVNLGAHRYSEKQYRAALFANDLKVLKKIQKKTQSVVPGKYTMAYIDGLPKTNYAVSFNEALKKMAIDSIQRKILKLLKNQIQSDKDKLRILFEKLNIPGQMAYC